MKHGKANGYRTMGCRCAECTEAHRLMTAEWRRKRRLVQGCTVCSLPAEPGRKMCIRHRAVNAANSRKEYWKKRALTAPSSKTGDSQSSQVESSLKLKR